MQNQLRDVKMKLEERKEAGESNLVIRFLKGVPTISKKRADGPSSLELNLYYQNERVLKTKLNILSHNTCLNDFDFICLSETWLSPDINNADINIW